MYSITIQADTMNEFASKCAQLGQQFTLSAPATSTGALVDTGDQTPTAQEPVKPKRQRSADKAELMGAVKSGDDEKEPAAGEESETQPAAVSEEPANENTPQEETPTMSGAVTYDDVKTATNSLAAKKGREAALALLSDFNVAKAQELAEAQWSDYVAQANERLAA